MKRQRLSLPAPDKISASGLAIYKDGGPVELPLANGLTAILGANGLGKSTLLNLVLYGITGLVRSPGHVLTPIKGPRGFVGQGEEYARRYFDGRVRREAAKTAYVDIEFVLGDTRFRVRRGFLDRSAVLALDVAGKSVQPNASLDEKYRSAICRSSGFASFEKFCFVVQTLQAFGEDRLCLLWEQVALSQIFFTLAADSPLEGEQLSSAVEEFKRADSNVRNTQWQITREKKLLAAIEGALTNKKAPSARAIESYEEMLSRRNQVQERSEQVSEEWSETLAKRDELFIRREALARELESATWKALQARQVRYSESPLARQFASTGICPYCATNHGKVPARITQKLEADECPLCDARSAPGRSDRGSAREALQALRIEKAKVDSRAQELSARADAVRREQADLESELRGLVRDVEKHEQTYGRDVLEARLRLKKQGYSSKAVDKQESVLVALGEMKKKHEREREAAKRQLTGIQKSLHAAFLAVRGELVPRFRDLAQRFIGIPLQLGVKQKLVDQMPLLEFQLTLGGDLRRASYQLSESQRFFLDIALRMTLLGQFAAGKDRPAFLLIDTPEGSLDSAYETNAGEMFGTFLAHHNGAIVAAFNLNASDLPRKAIEVAHKEVDVRLFDLREWGRVSDVQRGRADALDRRVADLKEVLGATT